VEEEKETNTITFKHGGGSLLSLYWSRPSQLPPPLLLARKAKKEGKIIAIKSPSFNLAF